MSWQRYVYVVIATVSLRCHGNGVLTLSWRCFENVVVATVRLHCYGNGMFTLSWRRFVYVVMATDAMLTLQPVGLNSLPVSFLDRFAAFTGFQLCCTFDSGKSEI